MFTLGNKNGVQRIMENIIVIPVAMLIVYSILELLKIPMFILVKVYYMPQKQMLDLYINTFRNV